MAHLVGNKGIVTATDLQQEMLDKTMSRTVRRGVERSIIPHLCSPKGLNLQEEVDFLLACNVLHEVPDLPNVLEEIRINLKADGQFI